MSERKAWIECEHGKISRHPWCDECESDLSENSIISAMGHAVTQCDGGREVTSAELTRKVIDRLEVIVLEVLEVMRDEGFIDLEKPTEKKP